jgi:IS30 family transposase
LVDDATQRLEYKQSQNVTKEERELMRGMRSKGESFRDIANILDRSVSTVHQNCQDVEVKESGVYY